MPTSLPTALAVPLPARVAVSLIFFANGLVLGSWAPRIPTIREQLQLGEGTLGLALLAVAVGALVSMPLAGGAVSRFGSRPVTTLTAIASRVVLPGPALSCSLYALVPALFLLGATNGSLDVAMNAQGVLVEKRYRRPILSSFHAAFSFGGLAGALLGSAAAAISLGLLPHLGLVACAVLIVFLVCSLFLLPAEDDSVPGPAFTRPPRRLLALGAVALCALFSESAMFDWSAVYLSGPLATSAAVAAWGFAAFSLTMACGRLAGDRLSERWGPVSLVRRGSLLASLGLGAALLVGHPLAAIVGFGFVGAGLAAVVPIVFTAGGSVPGIGPGPAIAAATTMGYAGFLVGPPVIGLAAEILTLPVALGFVVVACLIMWTLSPSVAPRPKSGPSRSTSQPISANRSQDIRT